MGDFNFKMEDELHKEFKVLSVREEKDMRDYIIELIKGELKKKGIELKE